MIVLRDVVVIAAILVYGFLAMVVVRNYGAR